MTDFMIYFRKLCSLPPGRTHQSGRSCPRRGHLLPRWFLLSALGGGALSCGGDTTTGPAPRPATQAYWALQLNQHAVNLALTAPYDTIHLTATPLTVSGTPLTGASPATFQVSDSTVTVSPSGLVTAHYVTTKTQVIAALTVQGVTLRDTAFIQVTPTPTASPLDTFSMQPSAHDSAKRAVDFNAGTFAWPVHATDATGTTVCDTAACPLLVYYASSNPLVAAIDRTTGAVTAYDTGHVVFTATTWAYGVAERDSVDFTVGYKLSYTIFMTLAAVLGVLTLGFAAPKKLILGVGAVVTFCTQTNKPVDVVFDQPPAVVDTASCTVVPGDTIPPTGSGNIAAFGGDTSSSGTGTPYINSTDCAARRFPTPGIYRYHSTLFPSDTFEIDIKQQ